MGSTTRYRPALSLVSSWIVLAMLGVLAPQVMASTAEAPSRIFGIYMYDGAGNIARSRSIDTSLLGGATPGADATRAKVFSAEPSSIAPVVAAEAERTVVIGRNMGERVIPYAESNGADWYGGTPRWVPRGLIEKISPSALEKTDLWFNGRWINSEMQAGSRIVDIGEPPGYPPSPFYNMERTRVDGYWNLFKDPQP
jgi:hypothetical protein